MSKKIATESFRKAAVHDFGQNWPNSLLAALAETTWAKDIIPKTNDTEPVGDEYAGLDDLGVGELEFELK